jgi:hypothetical protein
MARIMVSVISSILKYVDDTLIDEVILVIMDEITDDEESKFDYANFLAHDIHFQLASFKGLKSFRYQSYLLFLVLFPKS